MLSDFRSALRPKFEKQSGVFRARMTETGSVFNEAKPPKSATQECVKVVVRCRPMSGKEETDGHGRVVEMYPLRGVVELHNPKNGEAAKQFTFDAVYDWNSKQQELYDETFRPLVNSVLDGFNGTIFAYGQTGTGKTFTMEGVRDDVEMRGVIPNSFDHVFSCIARSENKQYLVRASYLEIYQEDIRDLLCKDPSKRLELKERPDIGVYVKDLTTFVCKSVKEIEHVMSVGNQLRSIGATNMNEHSSRSHAIFMVTIECSDIGADSDLNHIRVGKLNLVDLAGSERQAKTGATGKLFKEATMINLSLSALGNVISALVDGKSSHIPYRDSKLTRLLQDSLGGNAKTIMVANIGPASYNYDETLTTLRYANRAKNIKNKPKVNEDPKDALLREYQQEIIRLKEQLTAKGGSGTSRHPRNKVGTTEEDGDVKSLTEEEYLRQQQSILEDERKAILNNQSLIAEEKERLLQRMNQKQEELREKLEVQERTAQRLHAMESKLLSGGRNIVDHTNEQQRELELRRQEIADRKQKERDIQQALDVQEESAGEIKDTYTSLQQEVEIKTRKLKKLFAKLEAVKQEVRDVQEEHSRERQELEQTQNELTRELKLKYLIIENFIPVKEKSKILQRIIYDEDEDQWKVMASSSAADADGASTSSSASSSSSTSGLRRPVSAAGNRRPVSEFAKVAAAMGGNPRYKGENILAVELDMPGRTTRDYESPAVAPRVQAALDAALKGEDDLDIDASVLVSNNNRIRASRKSRIAQPIGKIIKPQPSCLYNTHSRSAIPKHL